MPGLDVRLAEAEDPVVLSPGLIIETLQEEDSSNPDTQDEEFLLQNSKTLRLEFKKIIKIENLHLLSGLTRLFLDNNFIEEISGLEVLPHLEWLDLSFNRIKKIENLEMQKNMKVLAIFNNCIEKIENLHHMTKLEVLRLGNNKISDRESILYMRKLQNLKTLSLKGNPITSMKDFEGFVAAFLPGLVYFEFKMVNSRTRRIFTELFQGELFKVQGKEEIEESKTKLQKEEKELKEREKKAFVDKLRGIDLLNSMFTQHLKEEEKIGEVQKATECQEKFKKDFLVILSKLYNLGLRELEEREIEWKRIEEGIDLAKLELEKDSLQTIQIFSEVKQDMLDRMVELGDQLLDLDPDSVSELQVQEVESYREEYRMKCKELNKNLLKHEVILINSIESMIEEYEQKLGSMTARFLNSCGGFLQEARDLETLYFQYLLELVDTFGGVRTDTLLSLVALCHDAHQKVLDRRQEGLRLAVNTWREDHFRNIRETEFNRSRSRVLEIYQFVDCVRQELEDIEVLPQAACVETDE